MDEVLTVLEQQQIIAVAPEPSARSDKIMPIEGIRWRWTWAAYTVDGAIPAVEDYLSSLPRDEQALELGLVLWQRLVRAESQAFYAQQLLRCQFNAQWQIDMGFAQNRGSVVLSIAQWRYCAWAAVRKGATMACQKGASQDELREAMYHELTRRAAALAAGRYGNCAFHPYTEQPPSALARGFAIQWFSLGGAYWGAPPNSARHLQPPEA
ncbi:hypothetical protein [Pseudoxanthomonas mexicana]|uniref:hypothetical protein n=1 Tax=Pseudoxanthomonas mexicana TaxID=128785 RepID=UPI0028AF7F70|nr:hypothetical protein [Pseudoxanthomonas mexicana]